MKAITIHQPWATLIALGAKKFETRSWATKYRGPLAIHAGKKIDNQAFEEFHITLWQHGIFIPSKLPTGAVIATVDLVECHKVRVDYYPMYDEEKAVTENGLLIEGDEYWFGDYTTGRYAWELINVRQIEPIPAKGQQRLWNWDGNGY